LKILLITGTLAEATVKRYAKESNLDTKVVALKVPVAAFLSPEIVIKAIKSININKFDLILVPGLMRGDTAEITKAFAIPTFKGPRYAADLPTVLNSLEEVKLSTVIPACDLLREKLQRKAIQDLENAEQNRDELLKMPSSMLIKNLAVGKAFPIRVMAEIVDAATMDNDEIQRLAKQFVRFGAHIIDLGMIAGINDPANARRIVNAAKTVVDVPVSIDTLNPAEIEAAVSAGADLILSADAGNIEEIAPYAKNIPVIVIPTNQREGYFPKKAEARVQLLEELIANSKELGFTKILADLILDPSNILESLIAYRYFSQKNPEIPLFVGISNVTELFDADSIGLNALLTRLSSELDASIILATEKSNKAKGTVQEEVIASRMMYLSKKRGSVTKDLGIDLLVLKDKRRLENPYDRELEKQTNVITLNERSKPSVMDERGIFRIIVDHEEGFIVALRFVCGQMEKPVDILKGRTAECIYNRLIELGYVSRLDHAAYIGNELAKAEIALLTGKEYNQDSELFKKKYRS
jgi:dihydropteroate synthase-like protein